MGKYTTSDPEFQTIPQKNLNEFSGELHSFDVKLAVKYGVMESVMIHHILFWIKFNLRQKKNFRQGRTWTFQSIDYICTHFPYLTKNQVIEILDRLCRGKSRKSKKEELDFDPVLLKGNFNSDKYDHTIWYAFVDENKWGIETGEIPLSIMENSNIDNGNQTNVDNGNFHDRSCQDPLSIKDINSKNTKDLNSKNKERESTRALAPLPNKQDFGEFSKVKLTLEEHKELILKLGEEKTEYFIKRLDRYLAQHKKKHYDSHHATILDWSDPKEQNSEGFLLAKHRQGSKLAYETKAETWKPNYLIVGDPA